MDLYTIAVTSALWFVLGALFMHNTLPSLQRQWEDRKEARRVDKKLEAISENVGPILT